MAKQKPAKERVKADRDTLEIAVKVIDDCGTELLVVKALP